MTLQTLHTIYHDDNNPTLKRYLVEFLTTSESMEQCFDQWDPILFASTWMM